MFGQVSEADARALISVFGALLAAFGFFYTAVRDTVRAGMFKDPGGSGRMEKKGLVDEAFWPGMTILAISSCVVALLMLPAFISVVSSIDLAGTYSASKSALVALTVFWLVLAAFWTGQAVRAFHRRRTW